MECINNLSEKKEIECFFSWEQINFFFREKGNERSCMAEQFLPNTLFLYTSLFTLHKCTFICIYKLIRN